MCAGSTAGTTVLSRKEPTRISDPEQFYADLRGAAQVLNWPNVAVKEARPLTARWLVRKVYLLDRSIRGLFPLSNSVT
jgi:hypothetical protein